jgi:propanol-preferring alcohol dehydrogenase
MLMQIPPDRMQAARLYEPGPVKIEEVATPSPGPGEVLVEVAACGVCGSDVHITVERSQTLTHYPRTPGHEAAGTVAALGEGVELWSIGDRVSLWCGVVCGTCDDCVAGHENQCRHFEVLGFDRDGAFAQYVIIPANNLFALPDQVPLDHAAILTDAVSTPYHALAVRGGLRAGESVAIFGVGGLGIHAVQLARMLGAGRVFAVDVRDAALARAREFGADTVIRADTERAARRIRDETAGRGVDLAVELIGVADAVEEAGKCLAHSGRLVLVGIGACRPRLPRLEPFVAFSQSVLGSFGARKQDLRDLIGHAAEGKLDLSRSITAHHPLSDLNACLTALHEKKRDTVRLIITPNGPLS